MESAMQKRRWLSARLMAVFLVSLGAAAVSAAAAKDSEPPANHSDAGNAPDKAPPPADNQTNGGKPAASQDGAPSANQADTGWGPIDTSITVQGPPKSRHGFKKFDRKQSKLFAARPWGHSADHHRLWTHGARVGAVRNAIGQPVHQHNADGKGNFKKGIEKAAVDATPKSSGAPANSGVGAVAPNPQHGVFVPLTSGSAGGGKPHDPRINTAVNHAVIDGRDRIRPGSGSVIGGANKIAAGVIDGTTFNPRHP